MVTVVPLVKSIIADGWDNSEPLSIIFDKNFSDVPNNSLRLPSNLPTR